METYYNPRPCKSYSTRLPLSWSTDSGSQPPRPSWEIGSWRSMSGLVAASQDIVYQIFFVYILAFLIPVGGLTHCIAGSTEVLVGVFAGEATFFEYLGLFLVSTTLGNTIGGLVRVALLNYGQVAGSEKASTAEYTGQDPREGSS